MPSVITQSRVVRLSLNHLPYTLSLLFSLEVTPQPRDFKLGSRGELQDISQAYFVFTGSSFLPYRKTGIGY